MKKLSGSRFLSQSCGVANAKPITFRHSNKNRSIKKVQGKPRLHASVNPFFGVWPPFCATPRRRRRRRMRLRAIPLAMITMRKSIHGFSLLFYGYGAPLGGLWPPEFRYETSFSVSQPFPSVTPTRFYYKFSLSHSNIFVLWLAKWDYFSNDSMKIVRVLLASGLNINRLPSCWHSTGVPDLGREQQQRVKTAGLGFHAGATVLSWICAGEIISSLTLIIIIAM